MHVLLIVCHPNPDSFTHAIAARVQETLLTNVHSLTVRDLYQERFDPVLPYAEIMGDSTDIVINDHIADLKKADALVIVHPNWWGKPPAMLAGWIDRVLRMDAAYTFPKGQVGGPSIGLLQLRQAIVFNTSNTTSLREANVFGDPLEYIWKNCVLNFCGVEPVVRHTFSVVVYSSADERKQWLNEVEKIVSTSFSHEKPVTSAALRDGT